MADTKQAPGVMSFDELIALSKLGSCLSPEKRAEMLEHRMMQELDYLVPVKSVIYSSGETDPTSPRIELYTALYANPGERQKHFLMGHDPRLMKMPDRPTLMDFFKYRFSPAAHLLQSANLARKNGYDEKIVLACLLHDLAMIGFMNPDHSYWGSQLVAPYVDEEIAWAIRSHQVLRFYPDESVGYEYPQMYHYLIGSDYKPEPYVEAAYQEIRKHKWYMSARLITLNDLYSFDPNVTVELEEFTDIIGRHFRQPKEGLGFDDSASAHMWRTINWPTRIM